MNAGSSAPVPAALAEHAEFADRLDALSRGWPATTALVLANVVVFAAMTASGAGLLRPDPAVHIQWGSNFGPLTATGEWWRLGTATFLHFGLLHLAFNMWALWDAGRLVERLYGTARFVVLYAVAGLAGSVASLAWNPTVNSAGASGAIFGVFGALIAFVLDRRNGVPLTVTTRLRSSALAFVIYSVGFGLAFPGIDNAAHLGGLVAGAAMGLLLSRPLSPDARAPAPLRVAAAALAGLAALALAASPLLRPGTDYHAEQEFRRYYWWLSSREPVVLGRLAELGRLAAKGTVTDAQFVDWMEREVMPGWRDIEARYAATPLPAGSRLGPLHDALGGYLESRGQMLDALFAAARTHDPKKLGEIDRVAAETARRAERLRQLEQEQSR